MKKLFSAILIVAIAAFSFVSFAQKGKKGKAGKKHATTMQKGTFIGNSKDSTFTIRHSDSATLAQQMPDGFKLVQKPR